MAVIQGMQVLCRVRFFLINSIYHGKSGITILFLLISQGLIVWVPSIGMISFSG